MVLSHVNSGRFPENPTFPRARQVGAPQARRAPNNQGRPREESRGPPQGTRSDQRSRAAPPSGSASRVSGLFVPKKLPIRAPHSFASAPFSADPNQGDRTGFARRSRRRPLAEALLLAPLSQSEGDSCEEWETPVEPRRALIGRHLLSFTCSGCGDEGDAGVLILRGGI